MMFRMGRCYDYISLLLYVTGNISLSDEFIYLLVHSQPDFKDFFEDPAKNNSYKTKLFGLDVCK